MLQNDYSETKVWPNIDSKNLYQYISPINQQKCNLSYLSLSYSNRCHSISNPDNLILGNFTNINNWIHLIVSYSNLNIICAIVSIVEKCKICKLYNYSDVILPSHINFKDKIKTIEMVWKIVKNLN